MPLISLGLLVGCTDDGALDADADAGLDGSGSPIDPAAFAAAMESSDGRRVFVSFAEPVAATLGEQKEVIGSPIFTSCGGENNPLPSGRSSLSGNGRVLEIGLCSTDDTCLAGPGGGGVCGNTGHFLVVIPAGTFTTVDDGEPVPELVLEVDQVPAEERPQAALTAPATVEVCTPVTLDATASRWPAGRTGSASIRVEPAASDGALGWDCAPGGCAAPDSLTLIPSRVTSAWPFVVTAIDSAGRVDVIEQTIEVSAGPEPTVAVELARDPATDDLLLIVTHEGGGCGDAPPDITLSATAGGEPVAVAWHPRLPGTVGVIAGIVVAGLRDLATPEITVTATLAETHGGGREATAELSVPLDDAAEDTALVIEGARRTFVRGDEGYRVHRTRVSSTAHFVDDWQGETAYLRVNLIGPDGVIAYTGDFPAAPDVTEIPHPSALLGDAATPGTWVVSVAAFVGDEQRIAPTMIDVELAVADLDGRLETSTSGDGYGDTVVARVGLREMNDEFGAWFQRPIFAGSAFAVTYPDGAQEIRSGSEEATFEIPRQDADYQVELSWAANADGVVSRVEPVELTIPARVVDPVLVDLDVPEQLPYGGDFTFGIDPGSLAIAGATFVSGTWTYESAAGTVGGELDGDGRGRVSACSLIGGGTLTIEGTAEVGSVLSPITSSGALMLRPPLPFSGTVSTPARVARSTAQAVDVTVTFDNPGVVAALDRLGGSTLTITGGSYTVRDDAYRGATTVDLSRIEPGRYRIVVEPPGDSCDLEGTVTATLDLNAAPQGGRCVVAPAMGDVLVAGEPVVVTASGFLDPEGDAPLRYRVSASGIDPVSLSRFAHEWNAVDGTPQEASTGLVAPGTDTLTCTVIDALGDATDVSVPVAVTTPPVTDFSGWDITPPELATGLVEVFGNDPAVSRTVRSFRRIDGTTQRVWDGPSAASEVVGVIVRPLSPTARTSVQLVTDARVFDTPFGGYGTVVAAFAPGRGFGIGLVATDGRPFDAVVDVVVRDGAGPRTIATWDAWGVPVLLYDNALGNTQQFALNLRREGEATGKLELYTCPGAAWEGVAVCGPVGGTSAVATRLTGSVARGATLWAYPTSTPDAPPPVGLALVAEFAGDMGISYQSP